MCKGNMASFHFKSDLIFLICPCHRVTGGGKGKLNLPTYLILLWFQWSPLSHFPSGRHNNVPP